jgi:hypothetical protein
MHLVKLTITFAVLFGATMLTSYMADAQIRNCTTSCQWIAGRQICQTHCY